MLQLDPASPCYSLAAAMDPALRVQQWNRPEFAMSAMSGAYAALEYTLQIMRITNCNTNASLTLTLPPVFTALQVYDLQLYNNNLVGESGPLPGVQMCASLILPLPCPDF